jgi:hypothetical protein
MACGLQAAREVMKESQYHRFMILNQKFKVGIERWYQQQTSPVQQCKKVNHKAIHKDLLSSFVAAECLSLWVLGNLEARIHERQITIRIPFYCSL